MPALLPPAPFPGPGCRRRVALLVLLALLPVTLLLAGQLALRLQAAQDRVQAALADNAARVAGTVARELQSSIDALEVLSQSELFQQGRVAALGRLLQGRPRRDWDSLFLFDARGTLVLDTGPAAASPAMRQLMDGLRAAAVRSGRPAVSGFIDPEAAPGNAIAIALPVRSGERIAYVLGARMDPAVFQQLASGATTGLDDRVSITDGQGRVVADSSGLPRGLRLAAEDPALAAAWRELPGFGWRVRVAQPAAPLAQARQDTLLRTLLAQGGALLLGALAAYAAGVRLCGRKG